MCYEVLVRISPGYPSVTGRLHTRYSPVRRSPSVSASWYHVAPRLACVRPVASVHPEPGSNSSLYDFFLLLLHNLLARDGDFYSSRTTFFVYCNFFKDRLLFFIRKRTANLRISFLFSKKIPLFSITAPLSRKACAKVRPFLFTSKFFPAFFYIPTINIPITACK